MSPNGSGSNVKVVASNNIYTVILGLAVLAVLATAVFVAYECYSQYETIFTIP